MEFCPSDESELADYFREASETPLLNADEEKQLGYRIQNGDSEARERLVRANLWLVVDRTRRNAGGGLTLLKLIEEGTLGLLFAVEAYDPATDTRFEEVANHWIEEMIRRALSEGSRAQS
jgi:RNA polymerase primary sigma factor